jgi:hypothetical protein
LVARRPKYFFEIKKKIEFQFLKDHKKDVIKKRIFGLTNFFVMREFLNLFFFKKQKSKKLLKTTRKTSEKLEKWKIQVKVIN